MAAIVNRDAEKGIVNDDAVQPAKVTPTDEPATYLPPDEDLSTEETALPSPVDEEKGPPPQPDSDPNIVRWDGPNDPANPQNWPSKKKWYGELSNPAM